MVFLALLAIALWCNRACTSGFILSLVIGLSAFAYLPMSYITDRDMWFSVCLYADILIAGIALLLKIRASIPVITISLMLCVGHLIDWCQASDHTYYIIANYLEYLEIIVCIIFSPTLLNYIRKKINYVVSRNY